MDIDNYCVCKQKDITVKKYIRTYDNVITEGQCESLVDMFDKKTDQHVSTNLESGTQFTEININHHKDWSDVVNKLYQTVRPYVDRYKKDVNIGKYQWPLQYGFEQIRFKRYLPNDIDEFKEHVDVGDYNSARRFLVLFLYLNHNKAGETSFPDYDIKVKPEPGKLLMFPPTWTYLHIGHKPKETPKYIIGTYLHYIEDDNARRLNADFYNN